jgi:hypothetical protein
MVIELLIVLILCLTVFLIIRACSLLLNKKPQVLAEYNKRGRELMKKRIVTDRALIQQYNINKGHRLSYFTYGWGVAELGEPGKANIFGTAIKIGEDFATNNMVRDEVLVQRGQKPKGTQSTKYRARELGQFCFCSGCPCYIDYGSTETVGGGDARQACCCECTSMYRSKFGHDFEKTKDVKYVYVHYIDDQGKEYCISVPKVMECIQRMDSHALASSYATVNAQQNNIATTSKNINIEITAPDHDDTKHLVNKQVLSNEYEANTNNLVVQANNNNNNNNNNNVTTTSSRSLAEEIKSLKQMKDDGIIDEAEFKAAKAKLLQ